jgi:Tol biopolymer transport system component
MLVLSPYASRAAFLQKGDVWVMDLVRGSTRLTSDGRSGSPILYPDGKLILYGSTRIGAGTYGLFRRAARGAGFDELVYKNDSQITPWHLSADGRLLAMGSAVGNITHLWVLPLAGENALKPTPVIDRPFYQLAPRFSPDGKLLAHRSNETGRNEIYVETFAAGTTK